MSPLDRPAVPVSMTLRDWLFVDGAMDNAVWSATHVDGDAGAAETGRRIREAGWAATRHVTVPAFEAGTWPPPDHVQDEMVTVALTAEEWAVALSVLRRAWSWTPASGEPGRRHGDERCSSW